MQADGGAVGFFGTGLTVNVALLSCGGDPLPLDLDVFPTCAAVELVDPDLSAAQLVRHCALRPHILLKIRRRVILPLFMQKGKIKYITVLLAWGRKLQLTVTLYPPPLALLPERGTRARKNELICKTAERNHVRKCQQELCESTY